MTKLRGFAKKRKFKKIEITLEVGPGLSEIKFENHHETVGVLIFFSSIQCVFLLY